MFIDRDSAGNIVGRFAVRQYEGQEWIADDDPALLFIPKEQRIAAIQSAYDEDKKRLDSAWLSATIADGVGESDRKAALVVLMDDLKNKRNADILAIIMEP